MIEVTKVVSSCISSNTYIVEENNEVVIIDAGATYNEIKSEYPNIDNVKVKGILLTHSHFDHAFALDELVEKFDCDVYVSALGKDYLSNPQGNLSYMGESELYIKTNRIIPIKDNEELNLISTSIKVIYTKGHCVSSVSYLIQNSLFTGDFLFYRTIGRTDLPYSSNDDMLNSLKKIKEYKFEECFAGHGRSFDYDTAIRTIEAYIRFLSR